MQHHKPHTIWCLHVKVCGGSWLVSPTNHDAPQISIFLDCAHLRWSHRANSALPHSFSFHIASTAKSCCYLLKLFPSFGMFLPRYGHCFLKFILWDFYPTLLNFLIVALPHYSHFKPLASILYSVFLIFFAFKYVSLYLIALIAFSVSHWILNHIIYFSMYPFASFLLSFIHYTFTFSLLVLCCSFNLVFFFCHT